MKNVKILVVTHKPYKFPKSKMYIPIQVNAENNDNLGYLTDNTGKNISKKNPNYCELTAMYWAWKNLDCDVIGINHYRRYLSFADSKVIKKAVNYDDKIKLILTKSEVINTLKNCDIIVPYTKLYTKNVYTKYVQQHYRKDIDAAIDIILNDYPDMADSVNYVMRQKKYAICNMCVLNKQLYNEYCEWIFDVLFKLEKKTDMTGYSNLQQRLYGFLSERLFNVWIDYKKLKVKEANMVALEHDNIKTLWNKAWHRILHIKL